MPEATQPPQWPSPRGPWHEYDDPGRLYDVGRFWCDSADGHPDRNGGYPDPGHHLPHDECRAFGASFDGVHADLSGPELQLELYAASPFRFGLPRDGSWDVTPRIVLEHYQDLPGQDPEPFRLSLPLGEALRLARRLNQLVDRVSVPPRPPLDPRW